MPKYKLLLRTIVHLRLKQIVYQLKYRITYSKLRAQKVPSSIPLRLVPFIAKWRCYDNDKTFTFLQSFLRFHFLERHPSWDALGIQSELYGLAVAGRHVSKRGNQMD